MLFIIQNRVVESIVSLTKSLGKAFFKCNSTHKIKSGNSFSDKIWETFALQFGSVLRERSLKT